MGEENTNLEKGDDKMTPANSNIIPIEINFKSYLDNQQSNYIAIFS